MSGREAVSEFVNGSLPRETQEPVAFLPDIWHLKGSVLLVKNTLRLVIMQLRHNIINAVMFLRMSINNVRNGKQYRPQFQVK